ncbi:amidase family protein [Sphingobium sp. YR768]|uniref:amidase family protein n=1 Tax=Sphingobium sp. YR768 TaxID=1884365 RepID=UPI0015A578E2|nr:amidase family protein [Sphingobium sp. YR768]
MKYQASVAMSLNDPEYLAVRDAALPMMRAEVDAIFSKYCLDAIVYPTMPKPAGLIDPMGAKGASARSAGKQVDGTHGTIIASETGLPEAVVAAAMTREQLPVSISFMGRRWADGDILGYAFDFEQATKAIRLPRYTPALPTDKINY